MIKIFYNNRILLFNERHTPELQSAKVLFLDDKTDQEVKLFLDSDEKFNLEVCDASDNAAMLVLQKCVKVIPAAGGLLRDDAGRVLFIRRFGLWDLPKGWLENGESLAECAVREVCEECGMKSADIVNEGFMLNTYHIYPFGEGFALKATSWYGMKYTGNGDLTPQTEEDIVGLEWFDRENLDDVRKNTYENIKLVIDKI